ncbi:MAG: hypothetical protein HKM89_05680 [Gemmatimonadales bacterium]|nr:hypothetical protein [Gemmatimonadales bacterium]
MSRRAKLRGMAAVMVIWITALVPTQLDADAASPPVTSPDEAEPIIVQLRLGRLVSRTVSGFRVEDDALIPLTQFLDLAEVSYQVHDDSRLDATFQPSGRRLSIDPARYKVQMDGRFVQTGPSQLVYQDGEYYIATGLLGGVLGLRFHVNWSDLRVTLLDAEGLPIARRIRRERARHALLRQSGGLEPDLTLGPRRNRWDGLVMDYSWLLPSDDPLAGSLYRVGLGTNAFGGSLTLSAESVGEAGTGDVRMRGSWSGVWQEDPWLKQLRLGDGFATGPQFRSIRGVSVTNSPFIRSSILGTIVYDGRLDPGWQVEAYQQGRLVAFDSVGTTGLYGVELPVQYGENPVDLVAYGPFGEERRFNRTYRVSRSLLPRGRWEYGAAAGECVTLKCEGTLNADIRYGATERVTFRAGFDRFWRGTLPDLDHPYVSVAASPTNAWTLEVEGALKAFGRGVLRYEPSIDLRISAEVIGFAQRTTAPLLTSPAQRSTMVLQGFYRPNRENRAWYFEGSVNRSHTASGTFTRATLGASARAHGVQFLPFVRWEWNQPELGATSLQSFAGVTAFFAPTSAWARSLGRFWIRTDLEFQTSLSPTRAALAVTRSLGLGSRIEAGVRWQRGGLGTTFTLALTSELSSLLSSTAVTAPVGGRVTGYQLVRGSAVWNQAAGRVEFTPGPSLDRGGVSGWVFLDENANGLKDPGEHGVPHVRVLIGSSVAQTDSTGRYGQWDLVPFEPFLVQIDSLSLRNPLFVSQYEAVSIVPSPNSYRVLDLPLIESGVIEGRVLREVDGAAMPAGALVLVLTNLETGEQSEITTFSDGEFYALGVRPGEYQLSVSPGFLDFRNEAAEPVLLQVEATPGGATLQGIELIIRRRN